MNRGSDLAMGGPSEEQERLTIKLDELEQLMD